MKKKFNVPFPIVLSLIVFTQVSFNLSNIDPKNTALANEKIGPNNIEKNQTWSSGSDERILVRFPDCWKIERHGKFVDTRNILKLTSSDKCPKSDQGNWSIIFVADHNQNITKDWKSNLPKGHSQEVKINGLKVNFYDNLSLSESKHGKEEEYPARISWIATFECAKPLETSYTAPVNISEIDRYKTDPVVPEVFKKFISGFECKK